jgi:hypothetical protein
MGVVRLSTRFHLGERKFHVGERKEEREAVPTRAGEARAASTRSHAERSPHACALSHLCPAAGKRERGILRGRTG